MQPIQRNNLKTVANLLSEAFQDDTLFRYLFPNPDRRRKMAPHLMKASLSYTLRHGHAFVTKKNTGVLYYLPPGHTKIRPVQMLLSAGWQLPFKLRLREIRTLLKIEHFMQTLHNRSILEPHFYLFGMGIAPEAQGHGIGSELLRHFLAICDDAQKACYLETQNPDNAPFYARHGFETINEAEMPGSTLYSWGMFRPARL